MKKPVIHPTAFVAPNATLRGDISLAADSSVFYGAVLRGDTASITIGEGSNIQDNCVVHVDHTVILNIAALADGDGGGVPPQHRAVKHAAVRGKGDVTAESGVGGHEGGGVDDGLFHRQMPLSLSFDARIVPHFSRISTVRQEKSRRIFQKSPYHFSTKCGIIIQKKGRRGDERESGPRRRTVWTVFCVRRVTRCLQQVIW